MSGEEQQLESKADVGASKTYPVQASAIGKNGYILINGRVGKVSDIQKLRYGKHGHAKCEVVAIDIINGKRLEDVFPSSHICDVPYVTKSDYQLINISEDGLVSLRSEINTTKDDVKLPTDEYLLSQLKDGFAEGKQLLVSVISTMGEDHISAIKEIDPM